MSRERNGAPASREMAIALLGTYRIAQSQNRGGGLGAVAEGLGPQPQPSFSPTITRLVQDRARQQRREQDYRARHKILRQGILRYEHRLAELRLELEKLEAEFRGGA
jgi:hypothetical protein